MACVRQQMQAATSINIDMGPAGISQQRETDEVHSNSNSDGGIRFGTKHPDSIPRWISESASFRAACRRLPASLFSHGMPPLQSQAFSASLGVEEFSRFSQSIHSTAGLLGAGTDTCPQNCQVCRLTILHWPCIHDHLHWGTPRPLYQSTAANHN